MFILYIIHVAYVMIRRLKNVLHLHRFVFVNIVHISFQQLYSAFVMEIKVFVTL